MKLDLDRRTVLALCGAIPFAAGQSLAADNWQELTIFEGRFTTMEPARPHCRFVAVSAGTIIALADTLAELEPWVRGRKVVHDNRFAGKVLFPGVIDPHLHPIMGAVLLGTKFIAPDAWKLPGGDAPGVLTPAAYRASLVAALAASTADPFITWGYHELFHGRIDRAELDKLAPGRRVVVWQRSFHELIVSSAMLEAWGIHSEQDFAAALAAVHADPAHGDYARGLLSETAGNVALSRLRPAIMAPEKVMGGLGQLQQIMRRSGVTTISDMATGIFAGYQAEAGMIRAAFERADATSRVMLMPLASELDHTDDLDTWYRNTASTWRSPHVRVDRRVKFLADGAFFALNMRMNAPGYIDGHEGKWLTEPDKLHAQFKRFWVAGFSFHIHVNGDEGLDVVLDGLATLPPRMGQTVTLEHLGYSTEAQNRRIARMGLMVSGQPNYLRVLGDVYSREGLGPGRAELIDRFGSLERLGVPLGLHSDFNMAPVDPLYLAWIAANRITLEGHQLGANERLSLDKALRAITIEAAQVIGMDALVGSIAPGKRADFAVLDDDPYALGAGKLAQIGIAGVVFEGRFVPA